MMWSHSNAPQLNYSGGKLWIKSYKGNNSLSIEPVSKDEAEEVLDELGVKKFDHDGIIEEGKTLEIGDPKKMMKDAWFYLCSDEEKECKLRRKGA